MSAYSRLRSAVQVLLHGAKPVKAPSRQGRYDYLLETAREKDPSTLLEIGVWRGDRAIRFLAELPNLRRYVGFDLFEDMTDDRYRSESMGKCTQTTRGGVLERLNGVSGPPDCAIDLIQGATQETLPQFVPDHRGEFDFIFIDGGHSLETIANDWEYSRQLVAPDGIVVFDDYYLNDASRGAKPLIDGLLASDDYVFRFFPMIESIIEGLQITMVMVKKAD